MVQLDDKNFIDIATVFLKKTIEILGVNKGILLNGIKTLYYIYRFTDTENKTKKDIINVLELTMNHYIEFIKQITCEDNLFLHLTPKDASLFVYKQLIFENMIHQNNFPSRDIYKKILLFFDTLKEKEEILGQWKAFFK